MTVLQYDDMNTMKNSKLIMTIFYSAIIFIPLLLLIFLLIISPGKPKPLTDIKGRIKGSISERVFIKIGGVRQGMFIRSTDLNNPVLLFAHGGPSFSEYFLVDKYPTGLENHFTVCYWEERGGGLSYSRDVTMESLTLDQLASDAIEVTNYLRERFRKDKIYLMAHSGGTAFAIQAAASFPQLFHAYIGVSQIARQGESEKLNYSYILDQYMSRGDKRMIARLEKYPLLRNDSLILPFFNSVLRDKTMHELGIGTMRNMRSIFSGVFFPVWKCRAYTLREKFNIWYSKFSFINKSGLRNQILNSDFTVKVSELAIPVYFISGKYDYTVNHDLSKEYLAKLKAPLKAFYTLQNSGHSPMFEEPDRFREIMTMDILNQKTVLADE